MKRQDYLVTTFGGIAPRKIVWHDAHEPLELDHPAKWILKQTPKGIAICEKNKAGDAESWQLIPDEMLRTGAAMKIAGENGKDRVRFSIMPLVHTSPVYAVPSTVDANEFVETDLYLFSGVGSYYFSYTQVFTRYEVSVRNFVLFDYQGNQAGLLHSITAKHPGLTIESPGNTAKEIPVGQSVRLNDDELLQVTLRWSGHWWRAVRLPIVHEFRLTVFEKKHPKEDLWFNRFIKGAVGFFLFLSVLIPMLGLDHPKPKIIEQTRITLKEPKWIAPSPEQLALRPTPPPPPPPKVQKREPPPPKQQAKQAAPKQKQLATKRPAPAPRSKPVPVVAQQPRTQVKEPVAPPPPSAKQVEAAKQQAAEQNLAKSLSFLSTPSGRRASNPNANISAANQTNDAKYATRSNSVVDAKAAKNSALNSIADNASNGSIDTRSARSVGRDVSGSAGGLRGGKGVRGKVSAGSLSGGGGGGLGQSEGLSLSGNGQMSEQLLAKTLEKYLPRFQYCYEKALLSNSTLAGTITAQWTIDESGAASGARVIRSQLSNEALHNCVVRELQKIPFPKPTGGAVVVKYPFSFSSSSF